MPSLASRQEHCCTFSTCVYRSIYVNMRIYSETMHGCIQVCVVHPKGPLQPPTKASMYAKGHSPGSEEFGQYARFGYDADAARDYGMPMRGQKTLGQVWQPWYATMLEQAGLQGAHAVSDRVQSNQGLLWTLLTDVLSAFLCISVSFHCPLICTIVM